MLPGFHTSFINYDMIHSDGLNLLWNQQMSYNNARWSLFQVPNMDASIGMDYPLFGQFGNFLTDPNLAIWQFQQKFNPVNFWNSPSFGFNGNNSGNFWNNMGLNLSNNGTSTSDYEYDALRALLKKYKELNPEASPELTAIKNALNKSGTIEEKKAVLKEAYKQLDSNKLQYALMFLDNNKKALQNAGYNFKGYNTKDDLELRKQLKVVKEQLKKDTADYTELNSRLVQTGATEDILRIISYWNDENKGSDERSIIRLIANNINKKEDEAGPQKIAVYNLIMSLSSKVEDIKARSSKDLTLLEKADEEMLAAHRAVEKDFSKEKLYVLAEKFENLYLKIRLMEAQRIKDEIKSKYNFLNDISTEDTDFINDDFIVKKTKDDLRSEGLKPDNVKIDVVQDSKKKVENKPEVTKEILEQKGEKYEVKSGTICVPEAYKYNNEYYRIKGDSTIIKLEDVTEIKKIESAPKTEVKQGNQPDSTSKLPSPTELKQKGKKIIAEKDGCELDQYEFYKLNGKIYELDGDTVKEAPAYIKEKVTN